MWGPGGSAVDPGCARFLAFDHGCTGPSQVSQGSAAAAGALALGCEAPGARTNGQGGSGDPPGTGGGAAPGGAPGRGGASATGGAPDTGGAPPAGTGGASPAVDAAARDSGATDTGALADAPPRSGDVAVQEPPSPADAAPAPASKLPTRLFGRDAKVPVSILALGGWQLGQSGIAAANAQKLWDRAIDEGITWIDSAQNYNSSHARLREILQRRRKEVVVVTKISEVVTMAGIEGILRQLGIDYLDGLHLHNYGGRTWGNSLAVMKMAKQRGLIRNIGLSGHQNPDAFLPAIASGDIDLIMNPLNFFDRNAYTFESAVRAAAKQAGTNVVAMKVWGGPSDWQGARSLVAASCPTQYIDDALRYSLGLPDVVAAVVGIKNEAELLQAIEVARSFRPTGARPRDDLARGRQDAVRDAGQVLRVAVSAAAILADHVVDEVLAVDGDPGGVRLPAPTRLAAGRPWSRGAVRRSLPAPPRAREAACSRPAPPAPMASRSRPAAQSPWPRCWNAPTGGPASPSCSKRTCARPARARAAGWSWPRAPTRQPGCRVTFKNYGFFVPTDSAGAQARVQGVVEVEKVNPSLVRHLEEEGAVFAHKDPDGSAREVRIVASGVELRRL